jgi:exodeoxyribonuclease VII small subunit
MPKKEPILFDQSLKELEALVKNLELGNLSIEDALKQFENGIKLSKHCNDFLRTAEQQIQILQQDMLRDRNELT